MDIEGLGSKTIDALISNKFISSITDLYSLDINQLLSLEVLQKSQLKTLSIPFRKVRKLSFIGLFIL